MSRLAAAAPPIVRKRVGGGQKAVIFLLAALGEARPQPGINIPPLFVSCCGVNSLNIYCFTGPRYRRTRYATNLQTSLGPTTRSTW